MAMATAHAHGGHNRTRINQIGLWLFILSETFLFGSLISGRYYLLGLAKPHELNQLLGFVLSVVLLVSSLTAYRAEIEASQGNNAGVRTNLIWTLLLGLGFLVGVGIEWAEAFHAFPPSTIFGTMFFTLTGLHAFHVLTGLIALLVVFNLAGKGRLTPSSYWSAEGSIKYWHFVDVAWLFIYPTLYLVN